MLSPTEMHKKMQPLLSSNLITNSKCEAGGQTI